jgi:pimeloyl-ACP methyl ester carboxylesterase
MQRVCRGRWLVFFLAGVALALAPAAGRAQTSQEVQFDTADKVELRGTLYPSVRGKSAPCVILLHKYGGNRQQNGWKQLAEALQKDYTVLSFDFRGHGDSTSVSPQFWRYPNNLQLIRGATRMPQKIAYKDFAPLYVPVLANDVTAAKAYLDQQNDAGVCNSSNVIIIGAEEGGAIGALWIASEWQRRRLVKSPFGQLVTDPQGRVEGEDIAAAVWLSIPRSLTGIPVIQWLRGPGNKVRDKVPMVFCYGDKDAKATSAAQTLFDELKRAGREKPEYTRLRAKGTKLAGNELLGKKSLGTDDDLVTYLGNVMEKRGLKAPVQRDTKNGPPLQMIPLQYFGVPLR